MTWLLRTAHGPYQCVNADWLSTSSHDVNGNSWQRLRRLNVTGSKTNCLNLWQATTAPV
jgi:hypothetical protein